MRQWQNSLAGCFIKHPAAQMRAGSHPAVAQQPYGFRMHAQSISNKLDAQWKGQARRHEIATIAVDHINSCSVDPFCMTASEGMRKTVQKVHS